MSKNSSVHVDGQYQHKLLLPPPHIVNNNFSEEELKKYLTQGIFDVVWFSSKIEEQTSLDIVDFLYKIISLDERNILSFRMCHQQSLARKMRNNLDRLLGPSKAWFYPKTRFSGL